MPNVPQTSTDERLRYRMVPPRRGKAKQDIVIPLHMVEEERQSDTCTPQNRRGKLACLVECSLMIYTFLNSNTKGYR